MKSDDEMLKTLKTDVRGLIVSCSDGLNIDAFLKDYKECIGTSFPFKTFGYPSAVQFLKALPDVLKVTTTSAGGTLLVPVESNLISHINNLVAKQRQPKRRKGGYPRFGSTKFGNRTYYQTVQTKTRRNFKNKNSCEDTYAFSDTDELDDFEIVWSTERPSFDEPVFERTRQRSPLKRPSPVSDKEGNVLSNALPSGEVEKHSNLDTLGRFSPVFDEEDRESNRSIVVKETDFVPPMRSSPLPQKEEYLVQNRIVNYKITEIETDKGLEGVDERVFSFKETEKTINAIKISEDHEMFISGLIKGIVLDSAKVIAPYERLLRTTIKPAVPHFNDDTSCSSIPSDDSRLSGDRDSLNERLTCDEISDCETTEVSPSPWDKYGCLSKTNEEIGNLHELVQEDKDDAYCFNKSVEDEFPDHCAPLKASAGVDKTNSVIKNMLPSMGRGSATKRFLGAYSKCRCKQQCCNGSCGRIGAIGRGQFLKSMREKYSNYLTS